MGQGGSFRMQGGAKLVDMSPSNGGVLPQRCGKTHVLGGLFRVAIHIYTRLWSIVSHLWDDRRPSDDTVPEESLSHSRDKIKRPPKRYVLYLFVDTLFSMAQVQNRESPRTNPQVPAIQGLRYFCTAWLCVWSSFRPHCAYMSPVVPSSS